MGVSLVRKKVSKGLLALVLLILVFSVYSSLFLGMSRAESSKPDVESSKRLVSVQYSWKVGEEIHLFLAPKEQWTFNASEGSDGFMFTSIDVLISAADESFLKNIDTNLYIESFDYWGGLGAWTQNSNFTLSNPTLQDQELFLKVTQNFARITYVSDLAEGTNHTIEFVTDRVADRVVVNWGFFGAMKHLEVNGSEIELSDILRPANQTMVEFSPSFAGFSLPSSQRIEQTKIMINLEDKESLAIQGYCSIAALLVEHNTFTLNASKEIMFEVPKVEGWTYLAGTIYSNLTVSAYPEPYPFRLINVAVWDANATPLLMTPTDTSFGIGNLANENYSVSFDVAFYYWQNMTGLTYSHQILESDESSIVHELSVNVSNANVGAELGLSGQYLRFNVPGRIESFMAPDPVGRFPGSFIPLMNGSYTFVTREDRIVTSVKTEVNDVILSNKINIKVTYLGEPCPDANVTVVQKGLFTSRTYVASTDENGEATIAVVSNGPELNQLSITVAKDDYNYTEQNLSFIVGASWILTALVVILSIVLVLFLIIKRRRKRK